MNERTIILSSKKYSPPYLALGSEFVRSVVLPCLVKLVPLLLAVVVAAAGFPRRVHTPKTAS